MKMPTVSFLTYDWAFGTKPLQPNGCAWYRCYLPMKELEKNGWESGIGFPGYNDEHGFGLLIPDNKAIHGWDLIVLKLIILLLAILFLVQSILISTLSFLFK